MAQTFHPWPQFPLLSTISFPPPKSNSQELALHPCPGRPHSPSTRSWPSRRSRAATSLSPRLPLPCLPPPSPPATPAGGWHDALLPVPSQILFSLKKHPGQVQPWGKAAGWRQGIIPVREFLGCPRGRRVGCSGWAGGWSLPAEALPAAGHARGTAPTSAGRPDSDGWDSKGTCWVLEDLGFALSAQGRGCCRYHHQPPLQRPPHVPVWVMGSSVSCSRTVLCPPTQMGDYPSLLQICRNSGMKRGCVGASPEDLGELDTSRAVGADLPGWGQDLVTGDSWSCHPGQRCLRGDICLTPLFPRVLWGSPKDSSGGHICPLPSETAPVSLHRDEPFGILGFATGNCDPSECSVLSVVHVTVSIHHPFSWEL